MVRGPDGLLLAAAGDALADAGIAPVVLGEKEGLALINGTDGMLAMLLLSSADLRVPLQTADVATAMSVESHLGTDQAFLPSSDWPLRPQPGQRRARPEPPGRCSRDQASPRRTERPRCIRVQDAYSLRCAPQVTRCAPRHPRACPRAWRDSELVATIDNPVVALDNRRRGVERQLPRRTARLRARLPRDRGRRLGCASRSGGPIGSWIPLGRSPACHPFLAGDPGVDSGT